MAAMVVALMGSAIWVTVASAGVHDNSTFELDANTVDNTATVLPDRPGTDWEVICREVNEQNKVLVNPSPPPANFVGDGSGDECAPAVGSAAGLVRKLFVTDDQWKTGSSDDQPATGATKDVNDWDGWDCKLANISPPKNDMLHAAAAVYSVGGNQIIYFMLDRFNSDNGNANVGFWFGRGSITCPAVLGGGAANFTANKHRHGDVLVTSAFTGGGGVSEILVFAWCSSPPGVIETPVDFPTDLKCGSSTTPGVPNSIPLGSGDGPIQLIAKGADCRPGTGDPNPVNPLVCATVNHGAVTAGKGTFAKPDDPDVNPLWPYQGAGADPNIYENGALFEGGINTTGLGLNLGCGGIFLADTRSSQSPTAQLHDFALGTLSFCEATLVTTPSTAVAVSPGTPVTDTAVVQGSGIAAPPTPTGNVSFFICGPAAVASPPPLCTTGGTAVGSPVALASSAPPAGEASATSAQVNTAASPLVPGRYCFRATWPGDTNYAGPLSDSRVTECFVVRTIPTTTVTTPTDGSGTALVSPLPLGTVLFDKAVVTANEAGGGNVTGTVDFFLCNPTQVTGGAGSEVCASPDGTALTGNPRTLVPIAAANPPSSSVLSSPGVAANLAGVWCFRAVYTPTGTTYTGSSDASHTECVTVSKAPTTTVTTPSTTGPVAVNTVVTDHAVVTGSAADADPTGTINFFVCSPSQLTPTNTGLCTTGGTAAGSKTATAVAGSESPPQTEATSDNVTANVVGKWCFRAEYVPGGANGGNYTGSSDSAATECFTVRDSTSGTSVQKWLPNDSATFTSLGGTALNGTLTFSLHNGLTCAGAAITGSTQAFTLTNAPSPVTRATTNTTVEVLVTSDVSWKAVFVSTDPLVDGSTKCESTSLVITN